MAQCPLCDYEMSTASWRRMPTYPGGICMDCRERLKTRFGRFGDVDQIIRTVVRAAKPGITRRPGGGFPIRREGEDLQDFLNRVEQFLVQREGSRNGDGVPSSEVPGEVPPEGGRDLNAKAKTYNVGYRCHNCGQITVLEFEVGQKAPDTATCRHCEESAKKVMAKWRRSAQRVSG